MTNIKVPSDINPDWTRVARCLEAAAKSSDNQGYCTVSITILVDKGNHPRLWTEPKVTKLHPRSSDALQSLSGD